MLEGKTLSITDPDDGLLANDYDPEGTSLTIGSLFSSWVSNMSNNRTSRICSDGTFAYQHQGQGLVGKIHSHMKLQTVMDSLQ